VWGLGGLDAALGDRGMQEVWGFILRPNSGAPWTVEAFSWARVHDRCTHDDDDGLFVLKGYTAEHHTPISKAAGSHRALRSELTALCLIWTIAYPSQTKQT
jgi:hypothetical protein